MVQDNNNGNSPAGSSSPLDELKNTINSLTKLEIWSKLGGLLKDACNWFIKTISREEDCAKRSQYQETFNSFVEHIVYLANHADIMLPRLDNNKGQFEILDELLNSKDIPEEKLKDSFSNSLKVLQENLKGFQDLDKKREQFTNLLEKTQAHRAKIAEEINKSENILSNKIVMHKKRSSGVGAVAGALAGAGAVGTLIGIEALGGCGKLAILGVVLTTPLQLGVAIGVGALAGAAILGLRYSKIKIGRSFKNN
jgi:hypothetical protein